MRAFEEHPGEKKGSAGRVPHPAAPASRRAVRRPVNPAEITTLQRLAGNRAVARLLDEEQHAHGPGCGHDGAKEAAGPGPKALLDDALASPSRPVPDGLRAEAESFYGNDFSAARLHDGPVAQRAIEAMGARAMTVGTHVFLPPGGTQDRALVGHEFSHVDKNLKGVRETGADQGSGVTVTDPGQSSERAAESDGTAFAAGAGAAPSVTAQRAVTDEVQESEPEREPAPTVQRMIIPEGDPHGEPSDLLGDDAVAATPGFAELHPGHQRRVMGLVEDTDTMLWPSEAIKHTRNTVVAAVDGLGGPHEGQFLADAYGQRNNLSAYSPDMSVNAVRARLGSAVPAGAATLEQGSVTNFGQHVPHTELFVPHPGPWAVDGGDDGLASCIERVLGESSAAYVVTDNEMPGKSQSQSLEQYIGALNARLGGDDAYRPLRVEVTTPNVKVAGDGKRTTEMGGVKLQIAHAPPYRLVTIRRT
ncbi:DUF4157 domain-containing protein [Streptomyces sp. NPDC047315]|uniref:eCIS core domain-containing protein n=1 Tax=Streptomyces sp. NPDC047315 TaxID=3155142 RepID=UPI0033DFB62A